MRPNPLRGALGIPVSYFLYYRESENRWVIDNAVNYTGGVYYYTQDGGDDLESVVFEKRNITSKATVQVLLRKEGDNIRVERFHTCEVGLGSNVSAADDGLYIPEAPLKMYNAKTGRYMYMGLQSGCRVTCDVDGHTVPGVIEKDNLDGTCNVKFDDTSLNDNDRNVSLFHDLLTPLLPTHYVKEDRSRHLYCEARPSHPTQPQAWHWIFSETCNAPVMGAIASSRASSLAFDAKGVCRFNCEYVKPNILEKICIEYVSTQDYMDNRAALDDRPIDEVKAALEDEGFSDLGAGNLKRWKDSNHESFLFSNQTGLISFLSLDADLLRRNMHPVLLKHLLTNHVPVGEDLHVLSDRHWAILSGLSGITRSQQDAEKVKHSQRRQAIQRLYRFPSRSKAVLNIALFSFKFSSR